MYQPIWFDYNKLTDDIMFLGNGALVQMNVALYKKDMKGNSRSFHSEFVSERDNQYNVSMKRSYEGYLTITKRKDNAYVIITANDIILMRMKLDKVKTWFENSTFAIKDDQYVITRKKEPIVVQLASEHKWIQMYPVVINKEDGTSIQGLRMNLYDSAFIDLTIDKFFGLKYLFDTIDLFLMASNMLNYFGRPELGTNISSLFEVADNVGNKSKKFFE